MSWILQRQRFITIDISRTRDDGGRADVDHATDACAPGGVDDIALQPAESSHTLRQTAGTLSREYAYWHYRGRADPHRPSMRMSHGRTGSLN